MPTNTSPYKLFQSFKMLDRLNVLNTGQNCRDSDGQKQHFIYVSVTSSVADYWRARKISDVNKKPLTSSVDVSKQQNVELSKASKTTTTAAIAAKTMSPKKMMSPKKTMASK